MGDCPGLPPLPVSGRNGFHNLRCTPNMQPVPTDYYLNCLLQKQKKILIWKGGLHRGTVWRRRRGRNQRTDDRETVALWTALVSRILGSGSAAQNLRVARHHGKIWAADPLPKRMLWPVRCPQTARSREEPRSVGSGSAAWGAPGRRVGHTRRRRVRVLNLSCVGG